MLTVKQPPTTYGYKSVHDLPTPPSTRPSPPLNHLDPSLKQHPVASQNRSPVVQPMSASHRGLPPPAAMTLPPQQASSGPPPHPPPSHHGQPQLLAQASHPGQQWTAASGTLPPPPQQWQGAEESMRTWLQAKTEEEKTKQEEERTRQESLRLEQRRVEMDILRASLGGGIPPPMVPLVFAGMGSGGILPQAALEWAQQFMAPSQGHHPQLLPPQRPHSPEHPRDIALPGHGGYPAAVTQGVSVQGPGGYAQYPGSPTTRPRGQTVSGVLGRQMGTTSSLASIGANPQHPGHGPAVAFSSYQGHGHTQSQSAQHEASPSIYFHHWQPPTSQGASGSNRPGTPSGEAQRKRKGTGGASQNATRAPSEDRFRSPPPFSQTASTNPSPSRRSHKRQRSDVSWYRPPGQMYGEVGDRLPRARTPPQVPTWGPPPRERDEAKSGKHSVSSLLSRESGDSGPASRQVSQPRLEPPPPPAPPTQRSGADPHGGDRSSERSGEPESRSRAGGSNMGEGET